MVALIIICVLILIIAILISFSLRIEIKYLGGKLELKVKYLFIILFPLKDKLIKPKKEKKLRRRKKSKLKKDESINEDYFEDFTEEDSEKQIQNEDIKTNSKVEDEIENNPQNDEVDEETTQKEKLSDKINKILDYIEKFKIIFNFSKKGLLRTFKAVHLDNLYIDFVIADENAYDAAMNFGKISAATYNLISIIRLIFPITVKTVDVICDFDKKESTFDGAVDIKMRLSTLIRAGLSILWGLILNFKALKGDNSTADKAEKNKVA